jgi:hypothetical protein
MSGFVDVPISATSIATDLIVPYSGTSVVQAGAALKLGVPGTPALYVPSVLNKYESGTISSHINNLTGSPLCTIKFTLIGNVVTLAIPGIAPAVNTVAATWITYDPIPLFLRPTATIDVATCGTVAAANTAFDASLDSSGVLTLGDFTAGNLKFGAGVAVGMQGFSLTYLLA